MDPRPVKIYSRLNTPRLRYITNLLLSEILGLSYEITTDRRKLGKFPVLNYSDSDIPGSLKIIPGKLLFEEGISEKEIMPGTWNGLPVIFSNTGSRDIPFDIFAASFYLVTRYEEYLESETDEHGRFKASSSVAFRNGFLQIPVVDKWTREFARIIVKRFEGITFRRNEFRSILTIDTDEPFEFIGHGIVRSLGEFLNDFTRTESHIAGRYRIISGKEKDPFEVFDYITSVSGEKTELKFFFPVGDHSNYDRNPSWKNSQYRNLIRSLSRNYAPGLHPSYHGSREAHVLNKEVMRLQEILGRQVLRSRFHYIRMTMPDSYRLLTAVGITEDYSMGYPEEPGFRAGIARPYYFYDLREERQTMLKIVPFQVMDETLVSYKHLGCGESRALIARLVAETREVGGVFVSIWHNTHLLDNESCRAWREVLEFLIDIQDPYTYN